MGSSTSSEVPRFHFKRVDVQVRDVNIPWLNLQGFPIAAKPKRGSGFVETGYNAPLPIHGGQHERLIPWRCGMVLPPRPVGRPARQEARWP